MGSVSRHLQQPQHCFTFNKHTVQTCPSAPNPQRTAPLLSEFYNSAELFVKLVVKKASQRRCVQNPQWSDHGYLVWSKCRTWRWRRRGDQRLRRPSWHLCHLRGCSPCLHLPPRPRSMESNSSTQRVAQEMSSLLLLLCRKHTFLCVSLSLLRRNTALSTATSPTLDPGSPRT